MSGGDLYPALHCTVPYSWYLGTGTCILIYRYHVPLQDLFGLVSGGSAPSSFTSPKKMMLLREAARESERNAGAGSGNIGGAGSGNIGGDDRLATLAGVASQLVASKSSVPGAETSAPEILVVPTSGGGNNDRVGGAGGGNVDVSANVTVETSRPRSLPTGIGLGVRFVLFFTFLYFQLSF